MVWFNSTVVNHGRLATVKPETSGASQRDCYYDLHGAVYGGVSVRSLGHMVSDHPDSLRI